MAIYKLVDNDNPILRVSLSGISEDCDREKLQEDLIETMKNFKGLGLSENQCGIMERVFVMYSDFEKREATACFNPKILNYSKEEVIMQEGCLSYPGLWLKVKRAHNILVEFDQIKHGIIFNFLQEKINLNSNKYVCIIGDGHGFFGKLIKKQKIMK